MDETQTLNMAQFPGTANVTGTSDLVITTNQTNTPPTAEVVHERFTLDYGLKGEPLEVEYEGQVGLLCKGWASRYNETDAAGEYQADGAFGDLPDTWAAQKEPMVLWQHGLDPVLTTRQIGKGVGYKLEPDGLYTEIFIPRDISDRWQDKRAVKKFKEIYNSIREGRIAGLSVGGAFERVGRKLRRWSVSEISVVDNPCLASARFTLGTKALAEKYGILPPTTADGDEIPGEGRLSRQEWNAVLGIARKARDHGLHDHLLAYEPAQQGRHDSEDCTICADRQAMGIKAVTKSEEGVATPSKCYLIVEDPDKPTTWHLRVRDPDGSPNHRLMGAAKAALVGGGFRGNPYAGPGKEEAIRKLKALYKSEGLDWEGNSGQGGKMGDNESDVSISSPDQPPPSYAEVLKQATGILQEFGQGVKAGRRHSQATRDAVAMVVDHLQRTFQLGVHDNSEDDAPNSKDA